MIRAKFLYRSYSFFHSFASWRSRHITAAGAMMAFMCVITGIFGLNMVRTPLYQATAISFAFLIVSGLLSLFPFRPQVRIRHIIPDYATVGENASYFIEITNLGTKPLKGMILFEDLHDPRPDLTTLLTAKEPYEHIRNSWDRKTLYYRWVWLCLKAGKASFNPVALPDLPPLETRRVSSGFVPRHRGYIHFTGTSLARPDILGLFMRHFSLKQAGKILVLPKRHDLRPPGLMARRQYHARGVHLASSVGNSDEFMSLRYYRPGDPMRDIHWRTFARVGELVIKEFEDEFFVRYAIVLDTFVRPEKGAVFEAAVSIAASYVLAVDPGDAILDLMVAGHKLPMVSSGRGLGRAEALLETLACIEPCPDQDMAALEAALRLGITKLSGVICIFSGWEKGHKAVCRMLKQANVPAFIIVLAEDEADRTAVLTKTRDLGLTVRVVLTGNIEEDLSK